MKAVHKRGTARKLTDRGSRDRLIRADMLKFGGYGEFDALYYYQPVINEDVMMSFSHRLAVGMKVGAYAIAYGSTAGFHNGHFKSIKVETSWRIFKKVSAMEEGEEQNVRNI